MNETMKMNENAVI